MIKKLLTLTLTILIIFTLTGTALADLPIKPVDDPWNNPENLIPDGNIYFAHNDAGYVVVWATPACDIEGEYRLLANDTSVLVENRVKYMNDIPWGSLKISTTDETTGEANEFSGWVLMTDLYYLDGTPAYVPPAVIPEHPMIANPIPVPTQEPEETAVPEETPVPTAPQRPDEAITVTNTYNNAIVYTSVAIAVVALALVAYVFIKHKALNNKGE